MLKAWDDGIQAVLADPAYQKEYAAREPRAGVRWRTTRPAAFTASFAADVGRSLRELGVIK